MTRFLSRNEFAKAVGISPSSLYRRAKQKVWPFNAYITVGSRVLYPASLIEELEGQALKCKGQKDEIPA
jgi:predicted DNA-binding transcriptional regulator AlpA